MANDSGHAEPRSGGDQRAIAFRPQLSTVERVQLAGLKRPDSICGRFQIIKQAYMLDAERFPHSVRTDIPGEVRRLDLALYDRPCDAEAGVRDLLFVPGDKEFENRLQRLILGAVVGLLSNDFAEAAAVNACFDERDVGFRATDISGENHIRYR